MARKGSLIVNIGAGDATTPEKDLVFKVYNGGSLIKTYTGGYFNNIDIKKIEPGRYVLTEIPLTDGAAFNLTVTVTNGAAQESAASNIQSLSTPADQGTVVMYSLTRNSTKRYKTPGDYADVMSVGIFNGAVITEGAGQISKIDNLTGSLRGIAISAPKGGWLAGNTYRGEMEIIDCSDNLVIERYTGGVFTDGPKPIVAGSVLVFEWTQVSASTATINFTIEHTVTTGTYFMHYRAVSVIDKG